MGENWGDSLRGEKEDGKAERFSSCTSLQRQQFRAVRLRDQLRYIE